MAKGKEQVCGLREGGGGGVKKEENTARKIEFVAENIYE
jgi:hypothetical protein